MLENGMTLFTGNIKGAKKIVGHRKGSKLEERVFIIFFILSAMFVLL